MRLVVHFSAFHDTDHRFVVKELTIANVDLASSQSWIFKAPWPLSQLPGEIIKSNTSLTHCGIGLSWHDGDTEYDQLPRILTDYTVGATALYAYGEARCTFLEHHLQRTVCNLEELNCPKYKLLGFTPRYCAHPIHRHGNYRCAVREASVYAQYVTYFDLCATVLKSPCALYNPTEIKCGRHVE